MTYVSSHGEGEEPEPPKVVSAVLVTDANILEAVAHLHVLGPPVVLQSAQRGVGQSQGGKSSQRF